MPTLNTLLILFFIIVFLVILLVSFFYSRRAKRLARKKIIFPSSLASLPSLKQQEINPDISIDDWDLHKLRLKKFRRSQYKGLTFFVSSENRIYYLSEKGDKIYC